MKRSIVITLATTLLLLPALMPAESMDKQFDSSLYDRVEVETLHGDISARAVSGDKISMAFEHSLGTDADNELTEVLSGLLEIAETYEESDDVDIDITEDKANRVLKVRVEMIDEDNTQIEDVDIAISLPSTIFVKLTSLNGSLSVDGNQAGFYLSATNGNITIDNTGGPGAFDATNGNVDIDSHGGDIKGKANNGEIAGQIVMSDSDGHCSLETVNSDIEVSVPSTVGATVSLSNVHGSSQVIGLEVKSKKEGDKVIKYSGDGSGTIHLETVNGNLVLKEI